MERLKEIAEYLLLGLAAMLGKAIKYGRKNKKAAAAAVVAVLALCVILAATVHSAKNRPALTLNGDAEVTVECGAEYTDDGCTATVRKTDISDQIQVTNHVDTSKVGTYEVEYQVQYKKKSASAKRTVLVEDHTAPTVTLNGDETVFVADFADYTESGATASDIADGDLTQNIQITVSDENDYTKNVHYEVKDAGGNVGSADRKVCLYDTVAPEIKLNGEAEITVDEQAAFEDPGATATDDRDGDISASVTTSGYVDVYRPGTYTVTYSVADAGGNTAEVTRQVTVKSEYSNPDNAVYLTFDDGPSSDVTVRVLDTLAANNIKATFFICNYDDENKALVQRMIDEGHTVGIHGYSHDYSQIYTSVDAFMNNINTLKDKVKADTGYEPFVIRFPGGSSNTISAKYCQGIMTQLVQEVTNQGLMYLDWNVSSGDAESNNRPVNILINNVTGGLKKGRSNVVLMHDTSAKQTSADALQSIITYGKNNGYCFYAVTEHTVPIHHGVKN